MSHRTRWSAVAALLLLASCSGASDSEPANQAVETQRNLPSGPSWVLEGTDLVQLSDIRLTDFISPLAGTYLSEQGGAELRLSISAGSGDRIMVTRSYEEPGLSAKVRHYQTERKGPALVSSDGSLTVRGTEHGVLAHEAVSGLDTIPPDYWIHYLRAP